MRADDERSEIRQGASRNRLIFTGLDNDSQVAREEIFGPVTAVMVFDDFDEAIRLANDTEYGLAANDMDKEILFGLQEAQR